MRDFDKNTIAIVGDGISGLVLAYRFVEKGYKVTLFSSKTHNKASLAAYGSFALKGIFMRLSSGLTK